MSLTPNQNLKLQKIQNGLIERLELVRLIKKNFEVIEWLIGDSDITRVDLLNQDKL